MSEISAEKRGLSMPEVHHAARRRLAAKRIPLSDFSLSGLFRELEKLVDMPEESGAPSAVYLMTVGDLRTIETALDNMSASKTGCRMLSTETHYQTALAARRFASAPSANSLAEYHDQASLEECRRFLDMLHLEMEMDEQLEMEANNDGAASDSSMPVHASTGSALKYSSDSELSDSNPSLRDTQLASPFAEDEEPAAAVTLSSSSPFAEEEPAATVIMASPSPFAEEEPVAAVSVSSSTFPDDEHAGEAILALPCPEEEHPASVATPATAIPASTSTPTASQGPGHKSKASPTIIHRDSNKNSQQPLTQKIDIEASSYTIQSTTLSILLPNSLIFYKFRKEI